MRPRVVPLIAFFLLLSLNSISSQDKSEANNKQQDSNTTQRTAQPPSTTVQINVGSPAETPTGQATKQDSKAEPKPFMTHGEWVISVITLIYVLISFLTLRSIRHSSERQLRAYVLPDNAGILDGTTLNPPQPAKANIPGVGILIKNSGQTPAFNVVSWLQIAIAAPAEEYKLVVPPLLGAFPLTLGANGTFSKTWWFDRPLTAVEIGEIAIGTKAIYLYGRIEYRDVFGKSHFSNFRLQYVGQFPPIPNAIFNFSIAGNDAN